MDAGKGLSTPAPAHSLTLAPTCTDPEHVPSGQAGNKGPTSQHPVQGHVQSWPVRPQRTGWQPGRRRAVGSSEVRWGQAAGSGHGAAEWSGRMCWRPGWVCGGRSWEAQAPERWGRGVRWVSSGRSSQGRHLGHPRARVRTGACGGAAAQGGPYDGQGEGEGDGRRGWWACREWAGGWGESTREGWGKEGAWARAPRAGRSRGVSPPSLPRGPKA